MIHLRRLQEAATGNVLRADILGEGRNYERKGRIAEGLKTRRHARLLSSTQTKSSKGVKLMGSILVNVSYIRGGGLDRGADPWEEVLLLETCGQLRCALTISSTISTR